MKIVIISLLLMILLARFAVTARDNDNAVIEQCHSKGGIIVHTLPGFACVKKEIVIPIEPV